jgi:cephalosporin hydroxylase
MNSRSYNCEVEKILNLEQKIMILFDSNHSNNHILSELF